MLRKSFELKGLFICQIYGWVMKDENEQLTELTIWRPLVSVSWEQHPD